MHIYINKGESMSQKIQVLLLSLFGVFAIYACESISEIADGGADSSIKDALASEGCCGEQP